MFTNDRIAEQIIDERALDRTVQIVERPIGVETLHAAVLRGKPGAENTLAWVDRAFSDFAETKSHALLLAQYALTR